MWVIAANLCLVGLAIESITIDWMPFTSLQGIFWLVAGVAAMQYRTAYITERTPVAPSVQPQTAALRS
jgi:hypothetical protein